MKNIRNSKSFTLVEVLVSLALIVLLWGATVGAIFNNRFLLSYSRHKMQAAYVAQQILEQERRLVFSPNSSLSSAVVILDTQGTYNTTADDFMGNSVVNVTNIDAYRNMVRVEINWLEKVGSGQMTMREYYTTTFANDPELN